MTAWSKSEIEFLKRNYLNMTHEEIARHLGKTDKAVRNKCWRLRLRKEEPDWTESEIKTLTEYYQAHKDDVLDLDKIASILGRSRIAVSIKARQLGLTQNNRPLSEEQKRQIAENVKRYIETHGHPKGMKGKTHSIELRIKMSERSKKMWSDPNHYLNSEEYRQKVSDRESKHTVKRAKERPETIRSRAASGKREDLGIYVRSSWEANVARYLNFLKSKGAIYDWQYEPDTFWFEKIKRGTRSFTPDFKIWDTPDSEPYYWEVKGYMDQKSRTKLKRMALYYPDVKVIVIGKKEYDEIKKWSSMIPNWEDGR